MIRTFLPGLAGALLLTSCSSVGVHSVQQQSAVLRAPSSILVEPFSAPVSRLSLGNRSVAEKSRLRDEIVANLANRTASQIRIHAADSAVVTSPAQIRPGTWLIRGEILRVDQGSRALRAVVGLGFGRTKMETRVTVYTVTSSGLVPLIRFKTTGSSGMEPGAALGVATGGLGSAMAVANAAGSVLMNSLPGVSSDIDRTSYETAAVLSDFLERHGLLESSRAAISPNIKGKLPTTVNLTRAIPAPLRGQ